MGNKEVRDILLGRILRQDERFWAAAPTDAKFHFCGIRDGASDVRLFGVSQQTRSYQMAEMEPAIAAAAVETALYSLGRPMRFTSMPDRKGCLYAPHWIAPVLLTVEQDKDGLQVSAYTGRSLLMGHFRCRIALRLFEQRLPEGFSCAGRIKKPDRKEAKPPKPSEKQSKSDSFPKKQKTAPKRLKK